jgi:hypothetical protein
VNKEKFITVARSRWGKPGATGARTFNDENRRRHRLLMTLSSANHELVIGVFPPL